MRIIVTVGLAVCLLMGLSILISALTAGTRRGRCPHCRNVNRRHARYCARCGTPLSQRKA